MQTLLILPGWTGSKESWNDFLTYSKKQSPNFDIQLFELPCFGQEPCPSAVWGVEEYANFVYKKIQATKLDPKHLIILGHSFGGQVAVELLSQHSNICQKLILSGPAIHRPKRLIKRAIFGMISRGGKLLFRLPGLKKGENLAKKFLYRGADSPDYQNTNGIQRKIFQKVIRQDRLKALKTISQPTLLLWGNNDTYVPYSHIKKIAQNLQDCKIQIMPGTHGLHNKTKEPFYSHIFSFIE